MRRLLALLVVLAISGCNAEATGPKLPQPLEQVTSAGTPAPGVKDAAAPTVPYLLKGRLHVDGAVLPGRYAGVVVRGKTWLGWERWDGPRMWGTGTTAHPLPSGIVAKLSPGGRFLATAGDKGCMGDAFKPGGNTCVIRLWDTSGAHSPRRLVRQTQQLELEGVTDHGAVLVSEYADRRWDELVWNAAGGSDAMQPLVDSAPLREWARQGWEPDGFGHAGFELHTGNVPGRWLGDIVDGEARLRFPIPEGVELGPDGAWILATRWSVSRNQRRELKGALELTAPTLRVRSLGKRGRLGAPVPLHAPTGWFFARATPGDDVVFWEDADTFVARVVDSRQSGDRLARCDLPLATCVLVGS